VRVRKRAKTEEGFGFLRRSLLCSLLTCCRSSMALFSPVLSCLAMLVRSWISCAGSSNMLVRFASWASLASLFEVL